MPSRRAFLATLLAAGTMPALSWADAGSPAYLAAAKVGKEYALFGLTGTGGTLFQIPLPGRAHAGAAHPTRPEALVFARRPGTFGVIVDCVAGVERARIESPEGHHFYGHAAFLQDGELLATTENHIESGEGRIGYWQRSGQGDYTRIGTGPTGGIGPHELRAMPDGATLVVANGGIRTSPQTGRDKLNLDTMRPNLSYVDADGQMLEQHELPADLHHNSIRHLDLRADGLVGFAMQWQGDPALIVPLMGLHRRGADLRLAEADNWAGMKGYAGSIAFSRDGAELAITSPRGGRVMGFDADSVTERWQWARADICGIAPAPGGFFVSDGLGALHRAEAGEGALLDMTRGRAWDNHIVTI